MERRKFIKSIAACTATLSLAQCDLLLAAAGFHEDGPYNGPLLTSYLNTTCAACPGGCGIRIRKVDDIPVKIDGNPNHPVNRGGLCPVGISSLAFLVHPDRIKQPLLRIGPRGSNEYQPISWEEAENLIYEKLSQLKNAGKPEQFLFLDSRQKGPGLELAQKFLFDFGSPNFYNSYEPGFTSASSIWGGENTQISYDVENARILFCFGYPVFETGNNPVYYAGLRNRLLNKPEGKKGSFIIIDSRLSASAAKAERWVPIKPGSYGLLALGMSYLIIKEQLYDRKAVNKHGAGFDDRTDRNGNKIEGFKSFVLKKYYPSFVSKHTGIPVDQIISMARLFATTPNTLAISGSTASHTTDGVYQEWAIMALNFITGKFGTTGGIGKSNKTPFVPITLKKSKLKPLVLPSKDNYPYLSGTGSIESLPERILSGTPYSIKVGMFNNINPLYDSSQTSRFRQALQNIPFSVVFTSMHNETSKLADLVLPDCSFLEKNDLITPDSDFSHQVVSLIQPVMKPLYNSKQSDEVILSLGKRFNDGIWKKWSNYETYLHSRLEEIYKTNTGSLFSNQFKLSFESLLAERGWRRKDYKDFKDFLKQLKTAGGWWDSLQFTETLSTRFPTSSGKFYMDSKPLRKKYKSSKTALRKVLKDSSLEPGEDSPFMLGTYREFSEVEESQYPLSLYLIEQTTLRGDGSRLKKMADMVGFGHNVMWQSWVELNPETAKKYNLSDKQMVWVESARSKQQMLLVINPGLVPEVAAVPSGLGRQGSHIIGQNINNILVTSRDCFTGAPSKTETKVKIYV